MTVTGWTLALLLVSTRSQAASQACLGTGRPLVIVDETLIGLINPEGFENQLRTALCLPLGDRCEQQVAIPVGRHGRSRLY